MSYMTDFALSYLLYNKIIGNGTVLSLKDSPGKTLGRQPLAGFCSCFGGMQQHNRDWQIGLWDKNKTSSLELLICKPCYRSQRLVAVCGRFERAGRQALAFYRNKSSNKPNTLKKHNPKLLDTNPILLSISISRQSSRNDYALSRSPFFIRSHSVV